MREGDTREIDPPATDHAAILLEAHALLQSASIKLLEASELAAQGHNAGVERLTNSAKRLTETANTKLSTL